MVKKDLSAPASGRMVRVCTESGEDIYIFYIQ